MSTLACVTAFAGGAFRAAAAPLGVYDLERDLAPASLRGFVPKPTANLRWLRAHAPHAQIVSCTELCLGASGAGRVYYAFARRPSLTSRDVVRSSIRVAPDPQTSQPTVVFQLTAAGRTRFRLLTRTIARAGRRHHAFGHLAIVVGARLMSTPYVDWRHFPNGLDAGPGIEISLPTMRAAEQLAAALRKG